MAILEKITKHNYHKMFKSPFYPVYDGWFNYLVDRVNSIMPDSGVMKMTPVHNATPGTSATINAPCGSVIMTHASQAGLASRDFTLTNSYITASSIVHAQLEGYGGTGTPIIQQVTRGAGSMTITVYNAHASAALSANFSILFTITG